MYHYHKCQPEKISGNYPYRIQGVGEEVSHVDFGGISNFHGFQMDLMPEKQNIYIPENLFQFVILIIYLCKIS